MQAKQKQFLQSHMGLHMDRLWSISVEPQQVQKHANTKQMFYWFEQAWACPVGSEYNSAGRTFLDSFNFSNIFIYSGFMQLG